jgi:hypothetical protein
VYRFFVVTSDTLLLLSIAKKERIGKQDKRRELKIAAAQNNDDNNIYRQTERQLFTAACSWEQELLPCLSAIRSS